MAKRQNILFLSLFLGISVNIHADVDYLNSLRVKTGLHAFTEQSNLRAAAQNHSAYLQINNITGHKEESTKEGYTGDYGYDRAAAAGYASAIVSENVSYGTQTSQESIDDLFSAIYHRFGFLSLENNEIGIGISNNHLHYTYNMGNSGINSLCQNGTYTGGSYYLPCVDGTKKINAEAFKNALSEVGKNAPSLILWPANNSGDIPPMFNEENPDPLPNYSVSGYPVSVEFNKKDFSSAPTVSSFTLETASGTQLDQIISMDANNDPNHFFSLHQFAIFPEKRLEWGSKYNAEIIYQYNGNTTSKKWCFSTRSLQSISDKFYRVTEDINVTVISGQTYAFYLVPHSNSEQITNTTFRYNSDDMEFNFIDTNTVSIKLTGAVGRYGFFELYDGSIPGNNLAYKVNLTIAHSDTATLPATEVCHDFDNDGIEDDEDVDDDNDGYSDEDEIAAGSNPHDANDKPLDTDGDKIPNIKDADDDNDGILDSVEIAHGLNPLDASDAQKDFDDDGFSNAIEINYSTDIRSAISHPLWVPIMMGKIVMFIPAKP